MRLPGNHPAKKWKKGNLGPAGRRKPTTPGSQSVVRKKRRLCKQMVRQVCLTPPRWSSSPRRDRCVIRQIVETLVWEMEQLYFPCISELNGVNCDPPELQVNADLFWQIWLKSQHSAGFFSWNVTSAKVKVLNQLGKSQTNLPIRNISVQSNVSSHF